MVIKKMWIAVLTGALIVAAPLAFADDHDEDRKERHHSHHKKKRAKNEVHHHHHYYYISRDGAIDGPLVIHRDTPVPPDLHADRPAPHALDRPIAKSGPAFPRESTAERSLARERQRSILERELVAEQELLDRARRTLADSSSNQERLQPSRDEVELHERNVATLRRELNNVQK